MKLNNVKSIIALFLGIILTQCVASQTGYELKNEFHIKSNGGWDYPLSDPKSNRLYISHGNQVNILDKISGDSLGVIENTTGVHGIAVLHKLNKGFTSNGRSNSVTVFNLKSNQVLDNISVGRNPDWIMYEKFTKKIITSNHSGGNISIIDPIKNKLIDSIYIGGNKLETIVSDEKGLLFINLEDKNQIAVVDLKNNKLKDLWSLAPYEEPTGLALDKSSKRLFCSCNKTLVIIDATNGKILEHLEIGSGTDGVAFDPKSKLIFTSNGEGSMSIIKEVSKNKYEVIETIKTLKGARTISLDESTQNIYLPTAEFEKAVGAERPTMKPGTMKILVYGKN
jgi:YVTN family beta-propeller protein